jgi:gliding motility-associated-like protein
MKKILLFLVLFSFFYAKQANSQTWKWAQRLGNIKSDKLTSIRTDDSGYIYIAGYFSTSTTIGTNNLFLNYTYNVQSKETFLAKLDSTGYCYWAVSGGEFFDDRVMGLGVDSAGNSTIVGTYWSGNYQTGGQTLNNSGFGGADQCFVVRHDRNGNLVWMTFVSSNGGDDQGLDVVSDNHGNAYVVGHMAGSTLWCGGNSVTATNSNTLYQQHSYWITKINAAGVFQWAKTFGNLPWDPTAGKYMERDIAVCIDEADGVYVTGGFDGTYPFGSTTLTAAGGTDIFVTKYDTNGNFKWATKGGSAKDDWSNGICSDKKGHIYITGEHRDSLFMDTIIVKNYNKRDAFVIKLDATTGKPIWGRRAGSNEGGERGNDIWADDHCNVYVCGDINAGAKFGDNITVPTGKNVEAFLARISPDGKWNWVVTGGGLDSNDRGNTLAKGKGNQIYVGGYFRSSSTYGTTNLASVGSSDAFFARVDDLAYDTGIPIVLSMPNDTTLCWGDTAKMTIPDHKSIAINTSNGVSFNADSTKLSFHPTTTTFYTITAISDNGCPTFDTISFTISVSKPPFAFNTILDSVICSGETVALKVPKHNFLSVSPMTSISITANEDSIFFNPSVSTTYTLIGGHTGTCPTADTMKVNIIVAPTPIVNFDLLPQNALIANPIFTLSNATTGATSYKWYRQDTLFSVSTNTNYSETQAGSYCYKLIATSANGCIDSMKKCGSVSSDERVFVGNNSFSPNGDGKNEEFKPVILNIDLSLVKDYALRIMNRYGEEIFFSKDPYFGWNGTYKGTKCDIGTYFYFYKFTTPKGKRYDLMGDVTLIK